MHLLFEVSLNPFKPFPDIKCPNCKKVFPAKTLSVTVQALTGKITAIRRMDIRKKFQFTVKGFLHVRDRKKKVCLCCNEEYPEEGGESKE